MLTIAGQTAGPNGLSNTYIIFITHYTYTKPKHKDTLHFYIKGLAKYIFVKHEHAVTAPISKRQ